MKLLRAVAILGWNVQVPKDSVKVKVEKGWIELTGEVDWQFQRVAAESAVLQLSGVVGVTNLIDVRPKVAPRDVKQKILDALKRHAELEADAIRVDVTDGKVVLEGNVKGWYERGIAERAGGPRLASKPSRIISRLVEKRASRCSVR